MWLAAAPSSISVVDIGIPLCSLVLSTLIFSRLKSDVQIENRGISGKKKIIICSIPRNQTDRALLPPEWCPKALYAHIICFHSHMTAIFAFTLAAVNFDQSGLTSMLVIREHI